MESSRPAADAHTSDGHQPRRTRFRRTSIAVAALIGAATLVLPVTASQASPQPSTRELKAKLTALNDQVEVLTEQYNGLRVQLSQAKHAAEVAAADAGRRQRALAATQGKVSQIAATSYMNGGLDPTAVLATSSDPQSVIDQAAVLHHMAQQDSEHLDELTKAQQAAQRARAAAQQQADAVQKLVDDIQKKKASIQKLVDQLQSKLFRQALQEASSGGRMYIDPSAIVGAGKAVEALRWALRQQGKPYVWGAAGPNAFDCSGLVMWSYKQVGINLPHYTGAQWAAGTKVSTPQPGDLVFFYSDLHHVGMYIGNGLMVNAPHTGDVVRVAPIAGRPVAGYVRVV